MPPLRGKGEQTEGKYGVVLLRLPCACFCVRKKLPKMRQHCTFKTFQRASLFVGCDPTNDILVHLVVFSRVRVNYVRAFLSGFEHLVGAGGGACHPWDKNPRVEELNLVRQRKQLAGLRLGLLWWRIGFTSRVEQATGLRQTCLYRLSLQRLAPDPFCKAQPCNA